MSHDEFEVEPVPGLPENLPKGETLLWQGSPDASAAARRVMHAGTVALYFGALVLYAAVSGFYEGETAAAVLASVVRLALVGAVAVGVLAFIARLMSRTTIYSITSRRVVMRYGIALPVTLNLPYSAIGSADLKAYGDGTGDIALKIAGKQRLGFLNLWPHVRGWRINYPQPSFRSVPDVARVATILVGAMKTAGEAQGATVRVGEIPAVQPRDRGEGYAAGATTLAA